MAEDKIRYRKVSTRIWNDARFRRLSANGKLAFLFCLTHPHTTAIGTIRCTPEGLSAELEGFAEGFAEGLREGLLKGSEGHPLIYIPKFLKHNRPENPNCVKSWRWAIDDMPECDLQRQILQDVKGFLERLPEGFRKGLPEGFPEPFAKGLANQEQEQEQEQEQTTTPLPPKKPGGGEDWFFSEPGSFEAGDGHPQHVQNAQDEGSAALPPPEAPAAQNEPPVAPPRKCGPSQKKAVDSGRLPKDGLAAEFIENWNMMGPPFAKIIAWGPERQRMLAARAADKVWVERYTDALRYIWASPFHRGEEPGKKWVADLSYFFRPGIVIQLAEKWDAQSAKSAEA